MSTEPSETNSETVSFKEKIQSIQFNAQGMRIPHTHVDKASDKKFVEIVDEKGRSAGAHTHYKSGRVDAAAIVHDPPNISLSSKEV